MKTTTILLSIILLTSINTLAQNNFKIENGQVLWQKVYNTNYKPLNGITVVSENDNIISFTFDGYRIPGAMKERTIVVLGNNTNGAGTIEKQAGKYRVTVSVIQFVNTFDLDSKVNFAGPILKKGKFRTDKKGTNSLRLVDEGFTQLFQTKTDNW